jgi:hypothetical protein
MTHTLKSIADSQAVTKRTAQRWLDKAREELGEIGTLIGTALTFTDDEAQSIIRCGASTTVAAKATTPPPTIYDSTYDTPTTSPTTALATIDDIEGMTDDIQDLNVSIVPTGFDLGFITGELEVIGDPLDYVDGALAAMDTLIGALDAKDERLQAESKAIRQKSRLLAEKAKATEDKVNTHKQRAWVLDQQKQRDIEEAQAALGKLQGFAQSS